jgi:hypothetical protein
MKKIIHLFLILFFAICCGPKQQKIEKTLEDGVEVIVNHLEPYRIKGERSILSLEKELTIDTERDEIAKLGLTDIGGFFDADSKGNVYLISPKSGENIVFVFDKDGAFVRSFGRKGRGPGELQAQPSDLFLNMTFKDEIAISDNNNNKISFFKRDGSLVKEIKLDPRIGFAMPLENGNYLTLKSVLNPQGDYINQNHLILCNGKFEEINELDRQSVPNPVIGKRLKGIYYVFSWSVAKQKIYTGFQERGYEIFVYDFAGKMMRKIKKQYKQVPLPEEYKKKFMKQFEAPLFDPIRSKIYFPDSMPPFHAFFADDEGRLLVMTYERGENPGEYIYDIFNPDGLFIGRKSLKIYNDENFLYARIKHGRLYCLNEKESGYKELEVYKVRWE